MGAFKTFIFPNVYNNNYGINLFQKIGEYTAYYRLIKKKGALCDNKLAIILIIIFSLFIIFTYKTPNLGIFKDPVNGSYGILL